MHVNDLMYVPTNTADASVLCHCAKCPLYIYTCERIIKYWLKILNMPDNRYVEECYNMLKMYDSLGIES